MQVLKCNNFLSSDILEFIDYLVVDYIRQRIFGANLIIWLI